MYASVEPPRATGVTHGWFTMKIACAYAARSIAAIPHAWRTHRCAIEERRIHTPVVRSKANTAERWLIPGSPQGIPFAIPLFTGHDRHFRDGTGSAAQPPLFCRRLA